MIGAVGHPWRTFVERFAAVLAAVVVLLAAGTLGFVLLGDWPVADAAWMTIITITAVGYDEVRELSPTTRALATGLLAGGITMMGIWFAVLTAAIVEMDLGHVFRTRRDMKNIEKLEDHVIVCGAGRTGLQIVAEMGRGADGFGASPSQRRDVSRRRCAGRGPRPPARADRHYG